ncbi:hypothetical protein GQ43DRAFT_444762 [Delitschia confertaspora ATCC 74209]|uniref:Uncharacterized protein n=1 Tax=Delitschia confertaspora ATCC 74209 TaxID=1513339 RepID=A0A9P4JEI4_9PLEO|nr:hypothetical protein GQ43DRAFT_444762 [Delitschia confertaspora ATCC 74209]
MKFHTTTTLILTGLTVTSAIPHLNQAGQVPSYEEPSSPKPFRPSNAIPAHEVPYRVPQAQKPLLEQEPLRPTPVAASEDPAQRPLHTTALMAGEAWRLSQSLQAATKTGKPVSAPARETGGFYWYEVSDQIPFFF